MTGLKGRLHGKQKKGSRGMFHKSYYPVCAYRRIVPEVKQFSLATRGLAVCSSFFSCPIPSVNLAFCNASQNSLDLLANHMEVSQSYEQDIRVHVWKAVLTHGNSFVFEFSLDVFEAFCECECPEVVEEIQYADLS